MNENVQIVILITRFVHNRQFVICFYFSFCVFLLLRRSNSVQHFVHNIRINFNRNRKRHQMSSDKWYMCSHSSPKNRKSFLSIRCCRWMSGSRAFVWNLQTHYCVISSSSSRMRYKFFGVIKIRAKTYVCYVMWSCWRCCCQCHHQPPPAAAAVVYRYLAHNTSFQSTHVKCSHLLFDVVFLVLLFAARKNRSKCGWRGNDSGGSDSNATMKHK